MVTDVLSFDSLVCACDSGTSRIDSASTTSNLLLGAVYSQEALLKSALKLIAQPAAILHVF